MAEAYPDLKANQNFLDLQAQLSDTENKIAVSRQVYNDTVLTYNNAIQTFPAVMLAELVRVLEAGVLRDRGGRRPGSAAGELRAAGLGTRTPTRAERRSAGGQPAPSDTAGT